MMWEEFEKLAGYEVSYETYSTVIEPMYMATPDRISKQEFVKMLNKKAFALPTKKEIVREMRKIASHIAETCEHYSDFEAKQKLNNMAKEYAKRFHGLDWANDLKAYCFFNVGYTGPNMRGCSYPVELVIGRDGVGEYERISLVR